MPTHGLMVDGGRLLKDGQEVRCVGVNYMDGFARALQGNYAYEQHFPALAQYNIPFVRSMISTFQAAADDLYFTDKEEHFQRLEIIGMM